MPKIQGLPIGTYFKTQKAVKKTVQNYKKAGFEKIETKSDKNGTKAVLAYDNDDQKEIRRAGIFYPDGRTLYKFYDFEPKKSNSKPYSKMIETYEKSGNGAFVFKERVTMDYNRSKVPHTVTKMISDNNLDDGVEFVVTHPYSIYIQPYKRPENEETETTE